MFTPRIYGHAHRRGILHGFHTPREDCYRSGCTLVFKEHITAFLRSNQLKSVFEFFDAAVRFKTTRGVTLPISFADCNTAWTNKHVGGSGNPASAVAKRIFNVRGILVGRSAAGAHQHDVENSSTRIQAMANIILRTERSFSIKNK